METAVTTALIAAVGGIIVALMNHLAQYFREKNSNDAENTKTAIAQLKAHNTEQDKSLGALMSAEKLAAMDRISAVGREYLEKGYVTMFYRRWLNDMHHVYHDELGGNGDLDNLMQRVNALPIKEE